jgi:hypothetical protein
MITKLEDEFALQEQLQQEVQTQDIIEMLVFLVHSGAIEGSRGVEFKSLLQELPNAHALYKASKRV